MIPTEQIEIDGLRELFQAAPASLAAEHGIALHELDGAICTAVRDHPESRIFNRAIGLGLASPATEADLDAAAEFFAGLGLSYYVSLSPDARPAELSGWLEQRGFVADYAWAKFHRHLSDPPRVETDLRVERTGAEHAPDFARIVRGSYDFPEFTEPWFAALPEVSGWSCYVAFDGDTPAGTGALYVSGPVGYLSFAATLPEHRRKGAQNALLSQRILDAAELGCQTLVTETGERVEERPSNSYRNIERAGFELAYLRPNYRSPEPIASR